VTTSPCIGVCRLDETAAHCVGCFRTLTEIASWPRLPEAEKLRVLQALATRRKDQKLRIVSFLPAATEMVCALGLADQLVGITHECDYPAAVRGKLVVVRSVLPVDQMSLREIDAAASERIGRGESLYQTDEQLLEQLAPTHILTQALCHVCAPSGNEIARVLQALRSKPQVLWFTPRCLEDIDQNLRQLGSATGRWAEAERIIAAHQARLDRIAELTSRVPRRPRVLCLEWTDPYYCAGHWVPEMVEIAGGVDALGRKGADSVRVAWNDIARWAPEVLIVMPCGFNLERAIVQTNQLLQEPGWRELPAVRGGNVFAVDANAYFARPGPRIVEGVELLAHLIHPELCSWPAIRGHAQFARVEGRGIEQLGHSFGEGGASVLASQWPSTNGSAGASPHPCSLKGYQSQTSSTAFTLVELLVVISVIVLLAGFLLPALNRSKSSARRVQCVGHLRQLGLAGQMYWDDNAGNAFRWRGAATNGGQVYWFGWLENGGEGARRFDRAQGALHPYLAGRGVEVCPALNYLSPQFKLKATGASFGYGYNLVLSPPPAQPPINMDKLARAAELVFLADSAQVNTFQAPASPRNPLLEEFYYLNTNEATVHFRHSRVANALFCDGHVAPEKPAHSSLDQRLPSQVVGRLRPEILADP